VRGAALDSGLPKPPRAGRLSLEKRYDEATAEFEQAIALDPNSFEGITSMAVLASAGQLERAGRSFGGLRSQARRYQSLILCDQIYRSLGRMRIKECARRGVERQSVTSSSP